jgi:hypothetical protein
MRRGYIPAWHRVLAALLDFFTIFLAAGYGIAKLTGDIKDNGFALSGLPFVALLAVTVAYFLIGRRYLGGTIWDRVFRIPRP